MIQALKNWWYGNGARKELRQTEAELREAVDEHMAQSRIARDMAERNLQRTNGLIKAAEHTLEIVKRGEG